jgi:hypothetical protein
VPNNSRSWIILVVAIAGVAAAGGMLGCSAQSGGGTGGSSPNRGVPECTSADACDDGDPCTIDICDGGQCSYVPIENCDSGPGGPGNANGSEPNPNDNGSVNGNGSGPDANENGNANDNGADANANQNDNGGDADSDANGNSNQSDTPHGDPVGGTWRGTLAFSVSVEAPVRNVLGPDGNLVSQEILIPVEDLAQPGQVLTEQNSFFPAGEFTDWVIVSERFSGEDLAPSLYAALQPVGGPLLLDESTGTVFWSERSTLRVDSEPDAMRSFQHLDVLLTGSINDSRDEIGWETATGTITFEDWTEDETELLDEDVFEVTAENWLDWIGAGPWLKEP